MKVLMVIKTTGLEYDDRLRKEVNSVGKMGICEILTLEYANQKRQRLVYEGAVARSIYLRSRNWFNRAKGLWIKIPEMYIRFLLWIIRKKPDVIWIHNLELMGLIPILIFLKKVNYFNRLIWDQHELPPDSLLDSKLFLSVYSWMMKYCDSVIMANKSRKIYVEKLINDTEDISIYVLNNFPDRKFIESSRNNLPEDVRLWLKNKLYLLGQGGANPHRNLSSLVNAVMSQDEYKLIIIGPYQEQQIEKIFQMHGPAYKDKILFLGFVAQMEIIPFIDQAAASVVFYDMESMNRKLCAPNRFYHAISRGTPVIVGKNPSIQKLVEELGIGIVVDSSEEDSIQKGFIRLERFLEKFQENVRLASNNFVWDRQNDKIFSLVRK